jgi:hypothetical protein
MSCGTYPDRSVRNEVGYDDQQSAQGRSARSEEFAAPADLRAIGSEVVLGARHWHFINRTQPAVTYSAMPMQLDLGNDRAGQFFTPDQISRRIVMMRLYSRLLKYQGPTRGRAPQIA